MRGVMRFISAKRANRILLGFLAPPISGSVLFVIYALVAETNAGPINIDRILEYFSIIHIIIFFAFLFVGIQSLAFSILMEFVVRPKFPKLRYHLLTSCILGFLSGLIPGVLVDDLRLFLPAGMLVGILVGLLIYDKGIEVDRENA